MPPLLRGLALGAQIGLSMALPLVVFGLGGRWLDRRLGTFPWFFLGGLVLAAVSGVILAVRSVQRVTQNSQ